MKQIGRIIIIILQVSKDWLIEIKQVSKNVLFFNFFLLLGRLLTEQNA